MAVMSSDSTQSSYIHEVGKNSGLLILFTISLCRLAVFVRKHCFFLKLQLFYLNKTFYLSTYVVLSNVARTIKLRICIFMVLRSHGICCFCLEKRVPLMP